MQGDQDAWAALYATLRGVSIHWARRAGAPMIPREVDYEDFVLEGWTKFWKARAGKPTDTFTTAQSFLGYLRACIQTSVVEYTRRRKNQFKIVDAQPHDAHEVLCEVEEVEHLAMLRVQLAEVLSQMSEVDRRTALDLQTGYSPTELAAMRGYSVDVLYKRRHFMRARASRQESTVGIIR